MTGYTAGTPGAGGSSEVTNTDAHAWAEVYFPTLGWIRLEPTPAGQDGTASRPAYMTAPGKAGEPAQPANAATPGPAGAPDGPQQDASAARQSQDARRPRTATHGQSAGGMPLAAVQALIAAVALALLAPAAIRLTRRQWRWMHATGDAARAHAAWCEFRDDLADFGLGAQPGEPPRTLAGRVSARLPEPASAAIIRLAVARERASYAGRPGPSQDLRRDNATARRGLARSVRRGTRWRARIFPASLLPRHRCRCPQMPRAGVGGHTDLENHPEYAMPVHHAGRDAWQCRRKQTGGG